MAIVDRNTSSAPLCPLGENTCPISDQIIELQQKIETLNKEILTDHLTGLYNKRHLVFSLEQEVERSQRSLQPTTLIMLDVDHFKTFNDTFGHTAGDEVLKHLSLLIKAQIRRLDIACRYGGEEFLIILPSSPLMIGVQVAERLRKAVETSKLAWNSSTLNITISLGVETFLPNSMETPTQFIERADKQLYKAKTAGRNCVKYVEPRSKNVQVSSDEKAALFDMLHPPK